MTPAEHLDLVSKNSNAFIAVLERANRAWTSYELRRWMRTVNPAFWDGSFVKLPDGAAQFGLKSRDVDARATFNWDPKTDLVSLYENGEPIAVEVKSSDRTGWASHFVPIKKRQHGRMYLVQTAAG